MNTEGYIAQRSSRREAGGPSADKVFQQLIQPRRVPATEPEMHLLAGATRVNTVFRGDRVAIWRWGHRGPAVLLVHGWDSRASHLGSFVEALLAAGYQVVAFDGPGHGDSGGHHSNVVLLGQAILQVVAAAGPVQAAIGHSMGSPALLYAFAHGLEVGASVHLAGPSSFRRVLERTASQTGLDAGGQRALMTLMEAETGIPVEAMELSHLARGLRHPSLLLHDPEDREVPYEESRKLGAAWPLSTLHAVSGVGHRRILGDRSVVGLSADFLRRTLPVNGASMQETRS